MNVVGLDIGYSNLKLAFAAKDAAIAKTDMRPAGAGPSENFGTRFDRRQHEDYLSVQVDNQEYIAGVSPDRGELYSRALHADYTTSASYKALFHAGLLLSKMQKIDVLVTGLPVSQYLDEARKEELAKQMQGEHQVSKKRTVKVNKVKVIPKPVGGLLDFVASSGADIEDANVLVIDAGFYSVDWVLATKNDTPSPPNAQRPWPSPPPRDRLIPFTPSTPPPCGVSCFWRP